MKLIEKAKTLPQSVMKLFKQKDTYISEHMKLSGDIDTDADISIDGQVYGNIRSKKHVMLGETAHFEGNIESDSALICGYFKGSITARRMLEVKAPATIFGDLISDSVRLESGVTIQGKILAKTIDHGVTSEVPKPTSVTSEA